jgi:hypothetical protein
MTGFEHRRAYRFTFITGASGSGATLLARILGMPGNAISFGGNYTSIQEGDEGYPMIRAFNAATAQMWDRHADQAVYEAARQRAPRVLDELLSLPACAAKTHIIHKRSTPFFKGDRFRPDLADISRVFNEPRLLVVYRNPCASTYSSLRRGFAGNVRQMAIICQERLTHLAAQAGLGRRVAWAPAEEFPALRAQYASTPGLKIFKNHRYTPEMGIELARHGGRGSYVYRDVRDVVLSKMRKDGTTFDRLMEQQFLEGIIQTDAQWRAQPNVLVSKYEEMMADLPGETLRIARHLGLALEREEAARIRAAGEAGRLREGYAGALFDDESMLHSNHLAGGYVGGWRSGLTAQAARLEDRAHRWLAANGYALAMGRLRRNLLAAFAEPARLKGKLAAARR